LNEDSKPLLCKYSEEGCDSAGVNQVAYFWSIKENCLLGKIKESNARMIRWIGQERYFVMNMEANANMTKEQIKDEMITNYRFEIYKAR
jgi:hypothetical protein